MKNKENRKNRSIAIPIRSRKYNTSNSINNKGTRGKRKYQQCEKHNRRHHNVIIKNI